MCHKSFKMHASSQNFPFYCLLNSLVFKQKFYEGSLLPCSVDSCYNKYLYPFSRLSQSHIFMPFKSCHHSLNTHEETGTKFTWHVNVYCCLKFSSFHGMLGVDVRDFFVCKPIFLSLFLQLYWNWNGTQTKDVKRNV